MRPFSAAYLDVGDVRQVLFYFMLYAFLGWALEHLYHKAVAGRFAGRGFLGGPFKPMYGFAPVILLALIGADTSWWWIAALAFAVPTAVEYVSGYLLGKLFHRQYWDYSDCRFQLAGYVCLRFSFYWTVLCMAVVYGLHPLAEALYDRLAAWWGLCWGAAAAWLMLDLAWTTLKYARKLPVAGK